MIRADGRAGTFREGGWRLSGGSDGPGPGRFKVPSDFETPFGFDAAREYSKELEARRRGAVVF